MKRIALTLILVCLVAAACTLTQSNLGDQAGEVRAWFDAPLPGSSIAPPNPCQIVAHGASPNGISQFELMINDSASMIMSPDQQSSLVTLAQDCGLTEEGYYRLLLRAQDNEGNWSGYAETDLTIPGPEEKQESPTPTAAGEETPTPTPATTGNVVIEEGSPKLVYVGSCDPHEITITALAMAPKKITVAVLFYRLQTNSSTSEWQSMAMNPTGQDMFRRTLNLSSVFGSLLPFDQASMQYQVVIQQEDGDTSIRTLVMSDVVVLPCGGGGAVSACSTYTDQSACEANGCNWVPIPAIVPMFACQAP